MRVSRYRRDRHCGRGPGTARRKKARRPGSELTKKLWVYIRANGLQDPTKKTLINADENLQAVFNGKKQASMFEMAKLVSDHVKK